MQPEPAKITPPSSNNHCLPLLLQTWGEKRPPTVASSWVLSDLFLVSLNYVPHLVNNSSFSKLSLVNHVLRKTGKRTTPETSDTSPRVTLFIKQRVFKDSICYSCHLPSLHTLQILRPGSLGSSLTKRASSFFTLPSLHSPNSGSWWSPFSVV